jgi:DNA-binding MarR family transcriptional regulator
MTSPRSHHSAEIDRIAEVLTRLRVVIGRRVISRVAIANVVPGAELSFIDVLSHIPELEDNFASPPTTVPTSIPNGATVGTVAQAMRIDPSRASRLVSNMVEQGLLIRLASPGDARSSYLMRTPLGQRLHQEMREVKARLIDGGLEGWTSEEIEIFATQFERFIGKWEQQLNDGDRDISSNQT